MRERERGERERGRERERERMKATNSKLQVRLMGNGTEESKCNQLTHPNSQRMDLRLLD